MGTYPESNLGNKSPPWKERRHPECLYMQIPKGSIEDEYKFETLQSMLTVGET
jgi:hypothetical protein